MFVNTHTNIRTESSLSLSFASFLLVFNCVRICSLGSQFDSFRAAGSEERYHSKTVLQGNISISKFWTLQSKHFLFEHLNEYWPYMHTYSNPIIYIIYFRRILYGITVGLFSFGLKQNNSYVCVCILNVFRRYGPFISYHLLR